MVPVYCQLLTVAYRLADGSRDTTKEFALPFGSRTFVFPGGFWGSQDGNVMYVANNAPPDVGGPAVHKYDLNTQTVVTGGDITLDPGNTSPLGMWSNGTTLWVLQESGQSVNGKIYAYNLSDGSRLAAQDFDTLGAAGNTNPLDLWSDGTTMWVSDRSVGKIFAYNLRSKLRDAPKDFTLSGNNASPSGIWSNGTTMWVADIDDRKVYTYDMKTQAPHAAASAAFYDPLPTCETVTLTEAGTTNGKWGPGPSPHEWRCTSIDSDVGGYTRFYDFFLSRRSSVTITLESDHATPRVFLREGGNSRHSTYPPYVGQYSNGDSRIRATLEPGAYTIEAAANERGHRGEFTLKVAGSGIVGLEDLMPLPAAVSCQDTPNRRLTPGQTVNGQWGPGCERSDLPTRPDLRPCTGPGCVFLGLRTTAYTRYYDFTLTEWKRVTITLTNNDRLPPDLKLREAGQPNAHSRYLAYGEESGTKASKIVMDLAPGNYVIEALNLDYPDPFFAKTGRFTIGYTTSTARVDCGRDISGTGEVEDHWFTGCASSVGYGYARFFTFTVPGRAGDDVKQTIKVNTFGQVPTLFPALWLRSGDDNRTGGYLAQANGLRHTSKTHYSSVYGYSQLRPRKANLTELSVNLAPGKYTLEVATGAEATGRFGLTLAQGDATSAALDVNSLHQIPDYSTPDVREGPTKPEGVTGASGAPQQSRSEPANQAPNRAPNFDANIVTMLSVAENSPAGTSVGAPITATDPDEGDTLAYSLSGDDAASFAIDSMGQITTVSGVTYDYEVRSYLVEPSYSLTVTADDGNGGRISTPVTVNLTDVDDAPAENLPPAFHEGESTTRQLAENSPAGTKVGKPVTAYDLNGDTLSFIALDGADGAAFALGTDGQITTVSGVTYDYETKSSYQFMLIVMETETAEGYLSGISVTLNLTDVNESPQAPDTAPTVADTSKLKNHYATVGQSFSLVLPAADASSGNGGPYTYQVLNRADGTAFSANGLSFDATTRTLSGTPTAEDSHELTYRIHDADDNRADTDAFVDKTLKIVVVPDGNAEGDGPSNTGPLQSPPKKSNSKPEPPPEPDPSPPTANAGADFNVKRGESVTLSGSGTAHAEGDQTLSYQWAVSAASDDELVTVGADHLSNASQAEASLTMMKRKHMTDRSTLDNGNWIEFTLTVSDGDGESDTDTVKVTIQGTTWTAKK